MRPAELDVTFILEQLDCLKTEDDHGGDEPYLWIVGFKVDADTITASGGLVPTLGVQIIPGVPFFKHVVGAGEVNAGETHAIAPLLGTRSFRLKPARLDGVGWFPGLAGVICLLWDEDGFSPSTSEAAFARFKQVLGPTVSSELTAMLGGSYDTFLAMDASGVTLPAELAQASLPWRFRRLMNADGRKNAVKELVKRVKSSIRSSIEDAIIDAAGLDELIDPDDLLGAEAHVSTGDEFASMVPIQLEYTDDEANYRVRGRAFGRPVHRFELDVSQNDSTPELDALVVVNQRVCGWPEKSYLALAYRVSPTLRFEVRALTGPAPSEVRWFIDGQPLPGGTSTRGVTFGPPKVFGLSAGNALSQKYPGGPGSLFCKSQGAVLEVTTNGIGTFSGEVRALIAFAGDPSLFPMPEPNAAQLLDRGYERATEVDISTIEIEMSDEFRADVERCARESIRKHLVQFVPLGWGERFERPVPPNWRDVVIQTQLAVQAILDVPTSRIDESIASPTLQRRVLTPRWHW